MWKVTDENYKYVEKVLRAEKEKNIYILGDIQKYGLNGNEVECFAGGECGEDIPFVLMRFCGSYVIYAPKPIDVTKELEVYFAGRPIHCISGDRMIINRIRDIFDDAVIVDNKMLKLDKTQLIYNGRCECVEENIRELNEKDCFAIQKFYSGIDEFREKFAGNVGIQKIKEQFHNGKIMGIYEDGQLASIAALSAETEEFAMVDNVATAKEYRKKGLCYKLLKRMCEIEMYKNNKQFLCVCCDDQRAENLYKKVGFREIGIYSMLYCGHAR